MSNKQLRIIIRWIHVIGGVMLGAFVYSPLREISEFVLLMQFVVIPVLTVSGLALWQQARLNKWLKG